MRTAALCLLLTASTLLAQVTRDADPNAPGKPFLVKAVRSDNGKPVEGARGYYTIDGHDFEKFVLDAKGEFRLKIPEKTAQLRLDLNKEGLVQYSVNLGDNPGSLPLTDSFTAKLLPGTTVGGTVQDQDGKPVEAIKIIFQAFYALPDHPSYMCNGSGSATTDAQGCWTFTGAPPEPRQMISIAAQHPDFLLNSSHQSLRLSQFEQLRRKELITTIRRGISVPGIVTDREGKPVPKARLGQDSLGLVNGTTSDDQGKFTLRGVEPGLRQMMASAPGYVAQEIDCNVTADGAEPLEFKLEKGRQLKIKVVDKAGNGLSGVSISLTPFRKYPRMNDYGVTDANGEFTWNGAPETAVTASLYHQGYARLPNQTFTAGKEACVQMPEAGGSDALGRPTILTARGTVVDDKTAMPIDRFQAMVTIKKAAEPRMSWSSHADGKEGKYAVAISEPGDSYVLRIDADGYLPFESTTLTKDQVQHFDVRLKRGATIAGVILTPDGQPADKADVALRENFMLEVDNGEFGSMRDPQHTHAAKTDAAGRFQLPARQGRVRVFAVHPSGWGEWVVKGEGRTPEPLKMWQWCKVEGTLLEKDKPLVGRTVRIMIIGKASDPRGPEATARHFFRYETQTDPKGHFQFDRVIDGPGEIQVELGREGPYQRVVNGYEAMLELKPGEHRSITFGGSGRPVVGKLKIGDDLKGKIDMPRYGTLSRSQPPFVPPPGYANLTPEQRQDVLDAFHQTPDYQEFLSKPRSYGVLVNPDGSFHAQDIPPGDYTLYISVLADKATPQGYIPTLAAVQATVKVPDEKSDTPLDLGAFDLRPRELPQ